jgi:hypothetical protein
MTQKKLRYVQKAFPKMKPKLKWQVGDYEQSVLYYFWIPPQFLLLCKILNVTPREVLDNFLTHADLGSWKRVGNEQPRLKASEYILACGYGKEYYSNDEIYQMLKELDSIGSLWPEGNHELIDIHAKWRNEYHKYWFDKWFWKSQREL